MLPIIQNRQEQWKEVQAADRTFQLQQTILRNLLFLEDRENFRRSIDGKYENMDIRWQTPKNERKICSSKNQWNISPYPKEIIFS